MTAATDEARARGIVVEIDADWSWGGSVNDHDANAVYEATIASIASALREARDEGARSMRDGLAAWLRAQAEERRITSPDRAADIESYAHILAATKLPSEEPK